MSTVELVLAAALIGLAGAGASAAGPTATIDDVVWSASVSGKAGVGS
jgi:hypothetical protein